ncbi:TraE/TraK family type IV conjugative transfer system protein [Methylococcus sp. EFPC2]|uniref:TraE/TraK family type IV conjugative transfer system protein n=1 Tax=Methylococcus sp. EFPC2 TaxID=2812648 RepID=UPI001967B01F|nr:TraE/TraK family type IV conjugative transfer system protein [Methylococcus sp. EFPC2]QSA98089.1 TraE protein [Methylococcus sp. EFPC2]
MKLTHLLESWRIVQAENRLHRVVLIGLVITNGISALAALRTERAVVLVPPNLTKEVEITRNTASSELKESWGLYLAELLGNVTPATSEFIANALAPLLSTEIYRSVMDAMSEQISAIKMDHIATSFKPRQVNYESETDKVFVTGELTTQGPNSKAETRNRTYEFVLSTRNYRPRLDYIDVYPDEPRTVERLKVLKQPQERPR